VPTGNFGDIFAGYVARHLLPSHIRNLVLATNENNLLTRFVLQGDYSLGTVVQTSSPSMDIQVASNFERYLYYLNNQDSERTKSDMKLFAEKGGLSFTGPRLERIQKEFLSKSVNEDETIETIRSFYEQTGYVLDPHTAVGVNAGLARRTAETPMICLATAHPAKFGEAVSKAIGREPELPPSLADLHSRESRCEVLDADVEVVKTFIHNHAL